MIFQGVENYKTGNATNTRLIACIRFVFLLFSINIDTNFDAVTVAPGKVVFFLRVWVQLMWLVSSLCNRKLFFS
jgi:hypothetical protein